MFKKRSIFLFVCLLLSAVLAFGCGTGGSSTGGADAGDAGNTAIEAENTDTAGTEAENTDTADADADSEGFDYTYKEYHLKRNGIKLHLDRITAVSSEDESAGEAADSADGASYSSAEGASGSTSDITSDVAPDGTSIGAAPERNILLVHGVTYSSHEFDIDYKDYSLARMLAREGYGVWTLDIAGYGRSEEVKDGFMPDSDYAAKDINAAVKKIVRKTGQDKIDLLGWSWGTVTVGRFVGAHPEHVNKTVLYAPIISGIGNIEVTEEFHHNTWEHAADDFQKTEDGLLDYDIAEPAVIEWFCSSCWHYDGEYSPNGGRRDICVDPSEILIDLPNIKTPTLVICGGSDPYLNYDLVDDCLASLPEGSEYEKIDGGSHVVYIERPYYHEFQQSLVDFLND